MVIAESKSQKWHGIKWSLPNVNPDETKRLLSNLVVEFESI